MRVRTRPRPEQSIIIGPRISYGDRRLVFGRRTSVTTTARADTAFGSLLPRHGPAMALCLAGEMFRWHCLSLDSYSHLVWPPFPPTYSIPGPSLYLTRAPSMDDWRLSAHASHSPARYGGGWRQCKPTRRPVIPSPTLDLASRAVLRGRAVVAAAEPVHVDSWAPRHRRRYRPSCHRSAAAMGLMTLSLTMGPGHESTLQLRQPLPPFLSLIHPIFSCHLLTGLGLQRRYS